jgi:SAM-dependent methyltransferase
VKPDLELRAGALAHFEDPEYYSQTYAPRVADVIHYVELAQKVARRGPVLEYGIGNGRIAIPMARASVRVVGIDHSRPMLADLARRLAEERPEVRARVEGCFGDMRKKKLRRRFDLVIAPFNVLLHLYTRADVEQFLARVREHLAPRGRFVMDLSVPVPEDLARDPNVPHGAPPFRHPTAGVVRYQERFDYDRARQILFVTMEITPKKAPEDAFVVPLAHRQFHPQEWEALLHYNGFAIDEVYGDFTKGPFDTNSDVMVVHARKAKR